MRIRILYDTYYAGTSYKKGAVIKIDRQQALYLIAEGRACFPTENRIKLPRENRARKERMEDYGTGS